MPRMTDAEQKARGEAAAKRRAVPEEAAQNPRPLEVDSTTIQRRKDIAAELRTLYTFLTTLHLPTQALKCPPDGGWAFVNAERFSCLSKSDAVIDLYKHIPYINRDSDAVDSYQIHINCVCVDYTGDHFKHGTLKAQCQQREPPQFYEHMDGEPTWDRLGEAQHIAVLAEPVSSVGYYILLDTRDGKVARVYPRDFEVDLQGG